MNLPSFCATVTCCESESECVSVSSIFHRVGRKKKTRTILRAAGISACLCLFSFLPMSVHPFGLVWELLQFSRVEISGDLSATGGSFLPSSIFSTNTTALSRKPAFEKQPFRSPVRRRLTCLWLLLSPSFFVSLLVSLPPHQVLLLLYSYFFHLFLFFISPFCRVGKLPNQGERDGMRHSNKVWEV